MACRIRTGRGVRLRSRRGWSSGSDVDSMVRSLHSFELHVLRYEHVGVFF